MSKREFKVFSVALICLALVLIAFCPIQAAGKERVFTYVLDSIAQETVDPQKTTEFYTIPMNIFDGLVRADTIAPGQSAIVPALAESWNISDDGLIYTFHLRKGVKFHNGEELKADDVLFTINRMMNPKTRAKNTDFYDAIKGAKEYVNGEADSVEGVKVIDDYTVELNLEAAYSPFLALLAAPPCAIFNRKATTEAGNDFGLLPEKTIGTGPFKLASWTVNDQITVEAFDDYFRGRPGVDKMVGKIIPDPATARMLFENAEIDVFDCDFATSQIPFFLESEKWSEQIVSGPRVGTYYYHINESIKPFDDVRVRKAFQYAIDRELLLSKLYKDLGSIANAILPKGLFGYNPNSEQISYDPEKSKELLAEAGYPNGFDMEIAMVSGSSSIKTNEVVQAMLADIGIKATLKQMDSAAFYGTRGEGTLPMYTSNWSADFNDPDNFIYTFFSKKNTGARSFNYNNPEVQDEIVRAREIVDPEERVALYHELERIIVHEDAAWLPLYTLDHLFVLQPRVKNFKVAWNGWSGMSYYGIEIVEE